jgi:hypothetical protein
MLSSSADRPAHGKAEAQAPPREELIDFYVNVNFDFFRRHAIIPQLRRFALAHLHKWTSWRISKARHGNPDSCDAL